MQSTEIGQLGERVYRIYPACQSPKTSTIKPSHLLCFLDNKFL